MTKIIFFENLLYRLLGGFRPSERGEPQANDIQRSSIDFDAATEYLANTTSQGLGIANTFSMGLWWKPGSEDTSDGAILFDMREDPSINNSGVVVTVNPFGTKFRVELYAESSSNQKNYDFGAPLLDVWAFVSFTWDGTTLKVYQNGVEDTSPTIILDQAVTMVDRDRAIFVGAPSNLNFSAASNGNGHSLSIWDSVLTANEMKTIYNHGAAGSFDLLRNQGDYVNATNLQHWYRIGQDVSDIGKDYGNASNLIDIMDNAANISIADISADSPDGAYIDFDGSTEALANTTEQSIGIANSWTIGVWWKPDNATAGDQGLIELRPAGDFKSLTQLVFLGDNAGDPFQVHLQDDDGSSSKSGRWNSILTVDTWVYLVATWDGTDIKLFRDGSDLGAPDTATGDLLTQTDRDRIIRTNTGGNRWTSGAVHSIAVWNTALSAATIKAAYNKGFKDIDLSKKAGEYKAQGNLVHWWRLGQPTGSIGAGGDLVVDQVASGGINIETNAVNISATDIIPATATAQGVSVNFDGSTEYLANTTTQALGVANTFSYATWWKLGTDGATGGGSSIFYLTISAGDNSSLLAISSVSDAWRAEIFDDANDGALAKDYRFGSRSQNWTHIVVTWDGTTFKVYQDGTEDTSPTKTQDSAVTMIDANRRVIIGAATNFTNHADGRGHSAALWDTALSANEIAQIYSRRSSIDLRKDTGVYVSATNLQHWWKLGEDPEDIGKDLGSASTLIDVMDNAANINTTDILVDTP